MLLELEIFSLLFRLAWGGFTVSYLLHAKIRQNHNSSHESIKYYCLLADRDFLLRSFLLSAIAIEKDAVSTHLFCWRRAGGVFASPILKFLGGGLKIIEGNNSDLIIIRGIGRLIREPFTRDFQPGLGHSIA